MNFTRIQLALIQSALQHRAEAWTAEIKSLGILEVDDKFERDQLFQVAVLRNSIQDYLLTDNSAKPVVPSLVEPCGNCGQEKCKHGIDAVNNGPLMCPLYLKNDAANWDGNYHKWRKFTPK